VPERGWKDTPVPTATYFQDKNPRTDRAQQGSEWGRRKLEADGMRAGLDLHPSHLAKVSFYTIGKFLSGDENTQK